MTTRIDAAQLIAGMEKNATNLMQLAEEMKQAALQVMAERTFAPLQPDQEEAKIDPGLATHLKDSIARLAHSDERLLFKSAKGSRSVLSDFEVAAAVSDFPSASKLAEDMIQAAFKIIKKDVPVINDFVKRQLEGIAELAEMIAIGIQKNTIRKESRDLFLKRLKDKPDDLEEALKEIFKADTEKAWNAMIGVLWKAVEIATGLKLPTLS